MRKKIIYITSIILLLLIITFVGGILWQPNIPDWRIREAKAFCQSNGLNDEYVIKKR